MGSKPRNISSSSSSSAAAAAAGRLRRRSLRTQRVGFRRLRNNTPRIVSGGASVSDKLEALRDLIPSQHPETNTDRLFQETADYIVLLRRQVFVLQKLVDFYGSNPPETHADDV